MTTIKVPSEENIFDWEVKSGEPLRTSNMPFEFFYIDDCGNKEAVDFTGKTFVMEVYFNDCLYLTSSDVLLEAPNKVYLNIASLDLNKGLYNYVIKMVGDISVISGKFRVYE